jgi:hypothetical protein
MFSRSLAIAQRITGIPRFSVPTRQKRSGRGRGKGKGSNHHDNCWPRAAMDLVYVAGEDTHIAERLRTGLIPNGNGENGNGENNKSYPFQSLTSMPKELSQLIIHGDGDCKRAKEEYGCLQFTNEEHALRVINKALGILDAKPFCEVCCQFHAPGSTACCFRTK